jgi:hypothetical protein
MEYNPGICRAPTDFNGSDNNLRIIVDHLYISEFNYRLILLFWRKGKSLQQTEKKNGVNE